MKQFILIISILFIQVTAFAQTEATAYRDSNELAANEQLNNLDLKVFPNPAKNQKVTLEMPADQITEIRLVNIVGKEVLKKNFEFGVNKHLLQLEEIPKGIYLVQVKTINNKAFVKKLLVSGN